MSVRNPHIQTVVAPHRQLKVFLAGGITDCPDWQADYIKLLEDSTRGHYITLFNPRREHFDISDKSATEQQIKWEHEKLMEADIVSFWFPKEAPLLCPITLFELGKMAMSSKPIIVGTDPEYKRRLDVVHQLALIRPDVEIHVSLAGIVDELRQYLSGRRHLSNLQALTAIAKECGHLMDP